MSHPNEAIANEVLSLLKALLFSGNTVVQKGLRDFVKETREEVLFANLKKILDDAEVHYTERCRVCLQQTFDDNYVTPFIVRNTGSHCNCS